MPPDSQPDFRDAAVAASEALIGELERRAGKPFDDPMEAGVSYCLRGDEDAGRIRARLRRWTLALFMLGMAGIAGGALLAGYSESPTGGRNDAMLVLAGVCSLSGFACLLSTFAVQHRVVTPILRRRLPTPEEAGSSGIGVEVEDDATADKLKMVSEDVGVLIAYPEARAVRIEGLSHRYLVFADDVVSLRFERSRHFERARLTYRIGGATLAVCVSPTSVLAALKRQAFFTNSRLFVAVRSALASPTAGA